MSHEIRSKRRRTAQRSTSDDLIPALAPAELEGTWEQLSHAIDGSSDGFWHWSVPEGRIAYSRHWADIIGVPIEELQGTVAEWLTLLHPDERDQVVHLARLALRGDLPRFDAEHRLRHRSGRWIWVRSRARVIERDDRGRAVTVAGSCRDVTTVKETERTLRLTLAENDRLITELRAALHTVKNLSELLPVCCSCKRFRDDAGRWHNLEQYLTEHAKVTHGICPACMEQLYPGVSS